jgi:hypothetical protein
MSSTGIQPVSAAPGLMTFAVIPSDLSFHATASAMRS